MRKDLTRTIRYRIVLPLTLILICMTLASCHVVRYFVWNFADVNDYKKFPPREVHKGDQPFRFASRDGMPVTIPMPPALVNTDYLNFEDMLERNKTVAFLVIRNDTVQYEKYFYGRDKDSPHTSFSMAKSFVSALVGIAISEGYIKSVDQPVTDFLPEITDPGFKKLTLEHLLNMRTGIKYTEGYFNPFGEVAKYYYGLNIRKYITKLKLKEEPGKQFEYVSVATQLLGMVVERATGRKLSEYLQEKIWQPLGMESDASWSLDSRDDGMERAFCCINATTRDFAKFGRLYLNNGDWNGKQIVPAAWVEKSTNPTIPSQAFYSYQWWLSDNHCFACIGFLGQYIFVNPRNKTIIVRLGKKEGKEDWLKVIPWVAARF